jgi:uncharacterized protein GlcG (DUF336 family)
MYERATIGLDDARTMLDAVLSKAAEEPQRPIAVVVVDGDGDVVASARMDRVGHLPRDMAHRKAYTAARLGADTDRIVDNLRAAGVAIADLGDPRFVGIAGGVSIRHGDTVIGAIGVSGRRAEEDDELARSGAASRER